MDSTDDEGTKRAVNIVGELDPIEKVEIRTEGDNSILVITRRSGLKEEAPLSVPAEKDGAAGPSDETIRRWILTMSGLHRLDMWVRPEFAACIEALDAMLKAAKAKGVKPKHAERSAQVLGSFLHSTFDDIQKEANRISTSVVAKQGKVAVKLIAAMGKMPSIDPYEDETLAFLHSHMARCLDPMFQMATIREEEIARLKAANQGLNRRIEVLEQEIADGQGFFGNMLVKLRGHGGSAAAPRTKN